MSDSIHPEDTNVVLPEPPVRAGWLTEAEIKDCWRTNMLGAADDARTLAQLPGLRFLQGPVFERMRERLKLAEGACRQMCHWREDARWLYLAPMLEELHQRVRLMITMRSSAELFGMCEQMLRKLVLDADSLENKATGRVGMILPDPVQVIRTDSRPVQVLSEDAA